MLWCQINIKGLSSTNLKYVTSFYENYPDLLVVNESSLIDQEALDQLENKTPSQIYCEDDNKRKIIKF